MHLGKQSVKGRLLLVGKLRRRQEPVRRFYGGTEDLPFRNFQISKRLQALECCHRRAGQIAYLAAGRASDRAEKLQNRLLQRRAALFFLRKGACLLRRNSQRRDLLRFACRALGHVHAGRDKLSAKQEADGRLRRLIVRELLPNGRIRGAAAVVLQNLHHAIGLHIVRRGAAPVAALAADTVGLRRLEPKPDRQDRPRGLIVGAEIPLPDERGQPKLPLRKHRLFVKCPEHCLELSRGRVLHLKDDPLAAAVAAPEGHEHTHSRLQRQLRRNFVGIGLVNCKKRGRNGNFCDHETPPSEKLSRRRQELACALQLPYFLSARICP